MNTKDTDVTLFRREIKYALPYADMQKVKSILDVNCTPVIFKHEESTVNSIYFDDLSMASCRANYDGHSIRTKLRIRWYDSEFPVKTFYFEIKRRNGQMIRKERIAVDIKEDLKNMPYERLLFLLGQILPHEYVESIMLRSNPIVLIEYKRRHYQVLNSLVRLTLDYHVSCYNQVSKSLPYRNFKIPLNDLVILEVKSPLNNEEQITKILYPLRLRLTRCSKYVLCCRQLGLSTGTRISFLE